MQPLPARVELPVDIRLQEEYLPALDLTTGRPLPVDDEPDVARLTDHHELDLETPVREAIQLAEPIAPLCRPGLPGAVHRLRPAARRRRRTTIPTRTSTRAWRRCAVSDRTTR